MAQSLSALELRLQNSRDEGRGCDVKFILHQVLTLDGKDLSYISIHSGLQ